MREEWLPVAGYEQNYEVSSLGQIRSRRRQGAKGGIRLQSPSSKWGYRNVLLTQNNRRRTVAVHTIVATAFLGLRPPGMEVRHLDGNPSNNVATNLRYGTKSENALDRIQHGNHNSLNKTQCPQGHPYDAENTGRTPNGRQRYCKTCKRIKIREYRRRVGHH